MKRKWRVGNHRHSVVEVLENGQDGEVVVWVPSWRSRLNPKEADSIVSSIVEAHNHDH